MTLRLSQTRREVLVTAERTREKDEKKVRIVTSHITINITLRALSGSSDATTWPHMHRHAPYPRLPEGRRIRRG